MGTYSCIDGIELEYRTSGELHDLLAEVKKKHQFQGTQIVKRVASRNNKTF